MPQKKKTDKKHKNAPSPFPKKGMSTDNSQPSIVNWQVDHGNVGKYLFDVNTGQNRINNPGIPPNARFMYPNLNDRTAGKLVASQGKYMVEAGMAGTLGAPGASGMVNAYKVAGAPAMTAELVGGLFGAGPAEMLGMTAGSMLWGEYVHRHNEEFEKAKKKYPIRYKQMMDSIGDPQGIEKLKFPSAADRVKFKFMKESRNRLKDTRTGLYNNNVKRLLY